MNNYVVRRFENIKENIGQHPRLYTLPMYLSIMPLFVPHSNFPSPRWCKVKDMSNLHLHFFLELCTNPQPLGMESKSIPNSAITASSTWPGYYTYYVRPGQTNCWYAESGKEKNSWIQVDLGKRTTFTGLETQGCSSGWTTTYSVSFSVDGNRWFKYEENSATKVCMNGQFPLHWCNFDLRKKNENLSAPL